MSAIEITISSIKAAFSLSATFINTFDGNVPHEKITELQELLLSAEENANVAKAEIEKLRSWDREKKMYSLKQVSPGVFVYALDTKDPKKGDEADPYFCANCFNQRKRSILQFQSRTKSGFKNFICHTCDTTIEVQALGK